MCSKHSAHGNFVAWKQCGKASVDSPTSDSW
jgi:hypothetical protein